MVFKKVLYTFNLFFSGKVLRFSNLVRLPSFLSSSFVDLSENKTKRFSNGRFYLTLSVCLLSVILFHCVSGRETTVSTKRSPEYLPSVQKGKVFLAGHQGDHSKNSEEILSLLRRLVEGTVKKDLKFLPDTVSPKEGVYLDLKGHWSKDDLISELKSPNNYFQTYFFDHELLEKQKGSSEVRTVRELLLLSGGIEADLFFESLSACEVKLRFKENAKLEKELINPYFIKSEGKWYLYRLF